jgi:glycine dehydrogenase subunit 1
MGFLINAPADVEEMLAAIDAASVDELFDGIPSDYRLKRPLDLPPALTELELTQELSALAGKNVAAGERACFLGGGSYDHFVPAVVDNLAARGEFYTSYTPYQPEVSQGNLQAMFEYQSLICDLTGMDVSNASLYEGATAALEGALMAVAVSNRTKVVIPESVHPEYRQTIVTATANLGLEIVVTPAPGLVSDEKALANAIDDSTACVLIQHPNFFGSLENAAAIAALAKSKGAAVVQIFDPISLGLLKGPGKLGADVAVAEGQSLGNYMAFGGPYLGVMTCSERFMRRLPGRIAGQTLSANGKRCWVLTLQTREQHIRREKATSNICTNQGLLALRSAIYLALVGPQGLKEVAELCLKKAEYLKRSLAKTKRFEIVSSGPTFKEFVVRDKRGDVTSLVEGAAREGFFVGPGLGRFYPDLDDCFLVAVTEKRTKADIDRLALVLEAA